MGRLVLSLAVSLVSTTLAVPPLMAQAPLPLIDEIVTEEAFAETYVNYQAAPENIDYQPIIEKKNLQDLSEITLIIELNKVADALKECQALRHALENEIGDRPGSYSINKSWVKKYQNCALARRDDIKQGEQKIRYLQNRIAREALRETAIPKAPSTLIIQLKKRLGDLKAQTRSELILQNSFVEYFNTGQKTYTE